MSEFVIFRILLVISSKSWYGMDNITYSLIQLKLYDFLLAKQITIISVVSFKQTFNL